MVKPQIVGVVAKGQSAILPKDRLAAQQVDTFWAEAGPRVRNFVLDNGSPRPKCEVIFVVCLKNQHISLAVNPLKPDLVFSYPSENFALSAIPMENTRMENLWEKLSDFCKAEIAHAWRCLLQQQSRMETIRIELTVRELIPVGHCWAMTGRVDAASRGTS